MENIFQNLLLFIMGTSSLFVLTSKNHVHSVMFLILVFIGASGILIFFGAEFISLIFIIVYVGAIAVLFLFIVMMLDIKLNIKKSTFFTYLPFLFLLLLIFTNILYINLNNISVADISTTTTSSWIFLIDKISNTELLGQILFNEFIICFLLCGILLLIAMVGAIVLTQKFSSKKTNELTLRQLARGNYPFYLLKKNRI